MYGAILGDIVGSRYEFSKPADFNFKTVNLFANNCFYTDDTVMTIATKYAVLKPTSYASAYRMFGRRYPSVGYGAMFKEWIDNNYSDKGYNSLGNGSAMRVSFIGEYFKTMQEVVTEAEKSAACTHNHPQGIKGAVATAASIYMAKNGYSKKEIKKYIQKNYGYNLNRTMWMIRPFSKFDITCEGSIPIALICFLQSDSWEECIRNVLSITCDTDTIGCIAGGIADAFYHGTGFHEDALLKKYLIKPRDYGVIDKTLYEWATKQ